MHSKSTHTPDLLSSNRRQLTGLRSWFAGGPCKLTALQLARQRQQRRLPLSGVIGLP